MASAFYWIDAGATLHTISISAGISYIEEESSRAGQAEAVSFGGVRRRYTGRQQTRIVVGVESDTSAGLRRDLLTMRSHLHAGGWVAFAGDSSQVGASFLGGSPLIGSTILTCPGYAFTAPATPSSTIASGTEVWIEGINAAIGSREVTRLAATWTPASSGPVTITDGTRYRYVDDGPPLLRTRDYYPRLVWPSGTSLSMARTRLRLKYDYVLTLEVDLGGLTELQQAGT